MPRLVPQQPPPPDYYADNVAFVLREVQRRSGELLTAEEARFISGVLGASERARRLFARLLSRARHWLRLDALRYSEVDCLQEAVCELASLGLVAHTPPAPADALLGLLTRAEQQSLFPGICTRTKREWITACLGRYPDALIRDRMAGTFPWIGVPGRQPFAVCQVLFFGSASEDLTAFIMQDLGLLRYETYALNRQTRPFGERDQLDRYLRCRRLARWSRELNATPAAADAIVNSLREPALTRTEQRARDRVLNRVGYWHERRGDTHRALVCYGHSTSHPARERRARILHREGNAAAVADLLAAMRNDPWGSEEEDFARRFPGRRSGADLNVSTLVLAGPTPKRIERFALDVLVSNGGRGWHLENLLPLGLAGLTFWEEIFAPVAGAFSHPLQLGPQDLFWPDFARSRRHLIEARLAALAAPGALSAWLRDVYARKRGTASHLVHWGAFSADLLDALLACVPEPVLRDLATYVIRNLNRARTGFPDLLVVYGSKAWELVEVKGPTDQLQPAQRTWLRTLETMGLPARVMRFRSC